MSPTSRLSAVPTRLMSTTLRGLLAAMLATAFGATRVSAQFPAPASDFAAPSLVTSTLTSSDKDPAPPCNSPDCVRRMMSEKNVVRLSGAFGSFTGRVAQWGPDSLAGFTTDLQEGGTVPSVPIAWSDVQGVDHRANEAGSYAVLGGLVLGTVAAFIAYSMAVANYPPVLYLVAEEPNHVTETVTGAAIGGVIGAGLGAMIGSGVPHWKRVYRRP